MRKVIVLLVLLPILLLMGCSSDTGFHWITPVATGEVIVLTPEATIELPTVTPTVPEVVPTEESGEVVPAETPVPPCDMIKGNIGKDGRRLYFTIKSINYKNVKIDESKGEKWFCSEQDAIAAGWIKAAK